MFIIDLIKMGQKQSNITSGRNDIVIEFLEIHTSVDVSILAPIKAQIRKRLEYLNHKIGATIDRPNIVKVKPMTNNKGDGSANGILIPSTCPFSPNGILGNVNQNEVQDVKSDYLKIPPGYDNLMLEKDIHQEFLNTLENCHSNEIGSFKRLSLEITFTVFKEGDKFYFEISDKDHTRKFEIDNGYSKYIATYDNYFNLFIAARFFRFDAKGKLKGFDAVFEILYPWPVLSVKSGQILYKSKKVDGPVLHIQINNS